MCVLCCAHSVPTCTTSALLVPAVTSTPAETKTPPPPAIIHGHLQFLRGRRIAGNLTQLRLSWKPFLLLGSERGAALYAQRLAQVPRNMRGAGNLAPLGLSQTRRPRNGGQLRDTIHTSRHTQASRGIRIARVLVRLRGPSDRRLRVGGRLGAELHDRGRERQGLAGGSGVQDTDIA